MNQAARDIGAVILAAGSGRRIGGPKALLPLEGVSFLERVLRTLCEAGLANIVTVVSPAVRDDMAKLPMETRLVLNPDPESDMLTSLRQGAAKISNARGVFAVPVDHPFVRAETYRELIAVFEENSASVVVPVHRERGGHPALLPSAWLRGLPEKSWENGLRGAIRESGVTVVRAAVDDPGVLRNVNAPSDLLDETR
jgi:CTP:molybdopterin cytidylyltransferase MocA